MKRPVKRVVIVRSGSAGLMSALALERFPQPMEITVVRSLGIPVIGVGESTTASLPAFLHGVLQLDRQSFYARVQPSWKLGIRFLWGSRNAPYFYYPFDSRLDAVHPEMQLAEAYHCYNDMRDNTPYTCLMERSRAPFTIATVVWFWMRALAIT